MATPKPRVVSEPLKRPETLGGRIYDDLVYRLKTGAIAEDQRLVDVELARFYGTSRMPVRDALMRLVSEGYLVGTTRGFAVPRLSADDVRDIFEVRRQLEPHAAANAARDLDRPAELGLATALKRARAARDDLNELILANIDFRRAWLGAVTNRRLADTIARFADQVHAVRLDTLKQASTRQVVIKGLEGLHAAFVKRDEAQAARRMLHFIDAAEQAYFDGRAANPRPRLVQAGGRG